MIISIRTTYAFATIKVDEIETNIFKSNQKEVEDMIQNLIDVADSLCSYTDRTLKDRVEPKD